MAKEGEAGEQAPFGPQGQKRGRDGPFGQRRGPYGLRRDGHSHLREGRLLWPSPPTGCLHGQRRGGERLPLWPSLGVPTWPKREVGEPFGPLWPSPTYGVPTWPSPADGAAPMAKRGMAIPLAKPLPSAPMAKRAFGHPFGHPLRGGWLPFGLRVRAAGPSLRPERGLAM
jgi:hypothetical protein